MSNKILYRDGLVFAILMSVSWIAYIIGGLAGSAWMIDFVPSTLPLADIWLPINILAVIVWMIAMSTVLARTDEPSTEPETSSALQPSQTCGFRRILADDGVPHNS